MFTRRAHEGQRGRAKTELEEAPPFDGPVVVVALLLRLRQDVNLRRRQPHRLVRRGHGRRERLVVGEEDLGVASRENRRQELRLARGVGDLLRREHDVHVLLPQRLEPRLEPRREDPVTEKEPRLVQDEQRRAARELLLDAVKEVLESRKDDRGPHGHQVPHLDHRPEAVGADAVFVRVEDLAEVALERVGAQRIAQRSLPRSDLGRQQRERPLLARRGREARERLVDAGLRAVVDRHALRRQQRGHELGGPDALGRLVDVRERLESHRRGLLARLVAGSAHGQGRGARAPVLVEDDDLRAWVLEPPERQHAEQSRLPTARRPEDECVADVADRQVQAKGRRAGGAAVEVRRADAADALEVPVVRAGDLEPSAPRTRGRNGETSIRPPAAQVGDDV